MDVIIGLTLGDVERTLTRLYPSKFIITLKKPLR